ncbi:polyhydroxyalkanoic acid system family protein [Sphingobium rhizovicinum]|uniref:Polyhydroxyalkanoic acid system family protein n=1 Tax=Sphingobium rhizovicinum TaxID=432308 RepID=A0ABV7NAE4_9SPHN
MDIEIPHDLGKAEARRRIEAGLPKLEQHIPGGGTVQATWSTQDQLDMEISAMGQTIPVRLQVSDDQVRGTVAVPMLLRMMAGPIGEFVKASAQKMLSRPA